MENRSHLRVRKSFGLASDTDTADWPEREIAVSTEVRPMGQDVYCAWLSLEISSCDIVPVAQGGDPIKLSRLLDLLSALTEACALSSPVLSALRDSVLLLLDESTPPEEEYVSLLRRLVALCPAALTSRVLADDSAAAALVKRVAIYNDLFANRINPTNTKPAGPKLLGAYLLDLGVVTQDELDEAVAEQQAGLYPGRRLGDILRDKGVISRGQLDEAIEKQMVDSMGT